MIIKSYELKKNKLSLINNNFFLLYGENLGLKKDIRNFIANEIKQKEDDIEILSLYESDVINNKKNFYESIYSASLFSNKKIVTVYEATDKIANDIFDVFEEYPENTFLIIFSDALEKKSKLRVFFEKNKKTIAIACYSDNEKDLQIIAQSELKKNNIVLSREAINLLIEKSNSDRNNLRNEIEKIKSYSLNKKKIELHEIKALINFSGDYKSDNLINECLCGNINQYKKIISELYIGAVNHVLLLRILGNKIHRLLKIKEQETETNNLDSLINSSKPMIFWKEKPLVKKQLLIWNLDELRKIISDINNTELLCKKNPQISNSIFFDFFSKICKKASNFS
jgi:DNA polymerase III subunit delta